MVSGADGFLLACTWFSIARLVYTRAPICQQPKEKPMTLIRLFGAAALLSLSSLASASSFIGTTDMIGSALVGTSESTTNLTSGDDKVVLRSEDRRVGK